MDTPKAMDTAAVMAATTAQALAAAASMAPAMGTGTAVAGSALDTAWAMMGVNTVINTTDGYGNTH